MCKNDTAYNKFAGWMKKFWWIPFISILVIVIFITLMVTLVGIRGIYVNVDDPNDFYSFTATDVTYSGDLNDIPGASSSAGSELLMRGSWKIRDKNILVISVKIGNNLTAVSDTEFEINSAKDKLILKEGDEETTYKRVTLINYDALASKVKVTFDMNGAGNNVTKKVAMGKTVLFPDDPKFDATHTFMGWYTTPYGFKETDGKRIRPNHKMWKDTAIYANWYNSTKYTVTVQDESGSDVATFNAEEGDNLLYVLDANNPSSGYTYDYTLDGVTVTDKTYMPAHNVTVKRANYRAKTYKVTYELDGGNFDITESDYVYGTTFTLPAEEPTKAGYVFRGWRLNNQSFLRQAGEVATLPASDVTFTAEWAQGIVFSEDAIGCTLSSFNDKYAESYTIPATYNGKAVISIGSDAFKNCTALKTVVIPTGVTSIGARAFKGCTSLETINIPTNATYIGSEAFSGCTALTNINIPSHVNSIGSEAFSGCTALETIVLPNNLAEINSETFQNCTALKSVNIPDSVTRIGYSAFKGCTSLTNCTSINYISIPSSVTEIGSYAFADCTSIRGLKLDGVQKIGYNAFSGCTALEELLISEGVTTIEHDAFSGCTALESVVIPDSVTSIGYDAFENAPIITIELPMKFINILPKSTVEYIVLTGTDTALRPYAFQSFTKLREIILPESLTEIGSYAFSGCTALEGIEIPNSIRNINSRAFENCRMLELIKFNGTQDEWANVTKSSQWVSGPTLVTVRCLDGSEITVDPSQV